MHYQLCFAHEEPEHRHTSGFTQGQTADKGHSWELSKSPKKLFSSFFDLRSFSISATTAFDEDSLQAEWLLHKSSLRTMDKASKFHITEANHLLCIEHCISRAACTCSECSGCSGVQWIDRQEPKDLSSLPPSSTDTFVGISG